MNTQTVKSNTHYRLTSILGSVAIYGFLTFVAIIAFFPFFTMIISSTHNQFSIATQVNILPGGYFAENYARLTKNIDLWRGLGNSAFIAIISSILELYFTAMAAYAFSKLRFKGQNFLFAFILVAMMIPGQIGIIGFFREMSDLNLINSYIPLILPAIANCFAVFFFKQYLDTAIPDALIEAAVIDGSGELRILHSMIFPLMVPALVTQGVLTFIGSWNSYLTPLIVLNEGKKMTLPVLIASIKDLGGSADYGAQYVGILISVIPLIIIFSLSSKLIMEKIAIGASVKG